MSEPQCKTPAECHRAWATVLELAERHGLNAVEGWKYRDKSFKSQPTLNSNPEEHSFAVAVVEGKWVFIGDKLWHIELRELVTVLSYELTTQSLKVSAQTCDIAIVKISSLTWNIPKQEPEIPEGFTKWGGGKCPVAGDTEVKVSFRDGRIITGEASCMRWNSARLGGDIIAYRVVKQYTTICGVKLPMPDVEGRFSYNLRFLDMEDVKIWSKFIDDCLTGKIHD